MPVDDPEAPDKPARLHEADATPVATDGDGAGGSGRGPDDGAWHPAFRARQLAAHGENQGKAEAAYQAYEARQAWAEAVPQLRASRAALVGGRQQPAAHAEGP